MNSAALQQAATNGLTAFNHGKSVSTVRLIGGSASGQTFALPFRDGQGFKLSSMKPQVSLVEPPSKAPSKLDVQVEYYVMRRTGRSGPLVAIESGLELFYLQQTEQLQRSQTVAEIAMKLRVSIEHQIETLKGSILEPALGQERITVDITPNGASLQPPMLKAYCWFVLPK